jgi:hypothetical protein
VVVPGMKSASEWITLPHNTQQTHADAAFDRARPLIDDLDDIFRELDFD